MTTMKELEAQFADLTGLVESLQRQLDGVRVIRPKAGAPVDAPCVLGNDPHACAQASTGNYQRKKCRGQSCLDRNGAYYAEQRDRAKTNGTPVAKPTRSKTKAAAPPPPPAGRRKR